MVDKKKDAEVKEEVKSSEVAPVVNKEKVGYRDGNMEYMKSMNPDVEIGDDNYSSMMDETMGKHVIPKMKGYDAANLNLKAMMESEPKLAKILADMSQGAKFEEVLPRYIDVANLTPAEGDDNYAAWEGNNKKRMDDYNSSEKRRGTVKANKSRSEKVISDWYDKKGMDDEGKKGFGTYVADLLDKAYSGDITPKFLDKMFNSMNYDGDVASAAEVGNIKGKNEKIVEGKMKEEAKQKGDGMPNIDGGSTKEVKEKAPDNSDGITRNLRNFTSKKSILG